MKSQKKEVIGFTLFLLFLAGSIVSVLFFYRGQKNNSQRDQIRIGVAAYRAEDTYVSMINAAINESAKAYQLDTGTQVRIDTVYAEESQSLQNDQINHFIKMGYDVICVNIVDRTSAGSIVDWVMEEDIPVVFFNREPVEEDLLKWEKAYYVGFDAKESGKLQGEIVLDYYKQFPQLLDTNGDGIIQYIMLEGEVRHQDTLIRTEKIIEELTASGLEMERVAGETANWSRSQAFSVMETIWKDAGNEVELVISNNDDMALGAVDFFKSKGIEFNKIVGVDGTTPGVEAVEENLILGTVDIGGTFCGEEIFSLCLYLMDRLPYTDETPELEKNTYLWLHQERITGSWVNENVVLESDLEK